MQKNIFIYRAILFLYAEIFKIWAVKVPSTWRTIRRKNAPVHVFDQWFTIQNGFYVIYERQLNAFCLQSKMADLSAYRDQQFKVIIFPLIFKFTLLNKLLFQGLTIFVLLSGFLGHARRVRKKVGNECDIVRGKFVVLHNGRTDLRVILASWRPKKDHYGTR